MSLSIIISRLEYLLLLVCTAGGVVIGRSPRRPTPRPMCAVPVRRVCLAPAGGADVELRTICTPAPAHRPRRSESRDHGSCFHVACALRYGPRNGGGAPRGAIT